MITQQQREAFEQCHVVPQDASYNTTFCEYRYAENFGVTHPVNEMFESFCDGARWQAAQQVPEGWKLVPVEPTPEMLSAGREKIEVWQWKEKGRMMKEMRFKPAVWAAMLDAAPSLTPTQEK